MECKKIQIYCKDRKTPYLMFMSSFSVRLKMPNQSFQPIFSGFNKAGAFNKVAEELDDALISAEDTIDTRGKSEIEVQKAAEDARKRFNTKPYEVKFIEALAQDVVDHFKSATVPLPPIPAAKMVKNAIAWIVAYKKSDGFNIRWYKPPKKNDSAGFIYSKLLKSKEDTIPWPADETEEQKAGWPISDTPIRDLQKIFDSKLTQLMSKVSRSPKLRPSANRASVSAGNLLTEKAGRQSTTTPSRNTPARESVGSIQTQDTYTQKTPEPLSFSKIMETVETAPYTPPEVADSSVQVKWRPRKVALSPAIDFTSPLVARAEANFNTEDEVDWGDERFLEDAMTVDDLIKLTESKKAGTKDLYAWFSPNYRGNDPDKKAIAFSRLVRDLRDSKRPVNEDNLFSYLKEEGPDSPEPSSQSRDGRRKRKTPGSPSSNA